MRIGHNRHYLSWHGIIHSPLYSHIRSSLNSKPWFSRQCSAAVRNKNSAYQAWESNQNHSTRSTFKQARIACKTQIENSKNSHIHSIAEKLTSCPSGSRPFWSPLKVIRRNFSIRAFPPLIKPDGSLATTPEDKANTLAEVFAKNFTLVADNQFSPSPSRTPASMNSISFHQSSISRILRTLDTVVSGLG